MNNPSYIELHRERFTTETADEMDDLALVSMELRKDGGTGLFSRYRYPEKAKVGAEKVVRWLGLSLIQWCERTAPANE